MKYLLYFLFLLGTKSYGQIEKGKFNTRIATAKNVTINNSNGTLEIKNANVIIVYNFGDKIPSGEVIVDKSITDQKFYIVDYKEFKNESGLYNTIIEFGNIGDKTVLDVDISVFFDKQFETSKWDILTSGMSIIEGYYNNKMGVFFKAAMMFSGKKCKLTVQSKDRLYTRIVGASGTFN